MRVQYQGMPHMQHYKSDCTVDTCVCVCVCVETG